MKRYFKPLFFFVGFMGTGKTTVGKRVSEILAFPYLDTDELLEEKFQMTVSQYFYNYGEKEFRKEEKKLLQDILLSTNKAIISTGGGILLDNSNLDNIKLNGYVILVKASFQEISQRLKCCSSRPLLKSKGLECLFEERKKLYTFYDFEIDTTSKDVDYVAMEVIPFILRKVGS